MHSVTVQPVTPDRWPALEKLFGPSGAYSGCWCMWWRMTRAEFSAGGSAERKQAMKGIVDSGEVPGVIAYVDGEPAGWCSIGPREGFGGLERSRKLKRIDDRPVWSIVCFFVGRGRRGQGLMSELLRGAVDYARERGAEVVEAYPYEAEERLPGGNKAYMGIAAVFRAAGFREAAALASGQLVMRRVL